MTVGLLELILFVVVQVALGAYAFGKIVSEVKSVRELMTVEITYLKDSLATVRQSADDAHRRLDLHLSDSKADSALLRRDVR